jgi:hypothetical protein
MMNEEEQTLSEKEITEAKGHLFGDYIKSTSVH